jgi:tRNA(adenine34) deaminase
MCMGACLNARIGRVVFAAHEPKFGACGSVIDLREPPGYNHRCRVTGGVRGEESARLLRNFFKARRA